ncbi:MAG: sulfotransferase, partial [Gammaproteobacteria bacterium]
MSASRLPDFVIIGAPKSATTWLLANLRAQPQIFMPGPELHFFNRNYQRGLGWYKAQFSAAGQDQIVGEKSASYLAHPEVPH